MDRVLRIAVVLLVMSPTPLFAQAKDAARPPQWWEQLAGVLAIPASIVATGYSYVLIKATRLGTRKTELEIIEKEKQLGISTADVRTVSQLVTPLVQDKRVQFLLLRFLLLDISLRLWGVVDDGIRAATGGAVLWAQRIGISIELTGAREFLLIGVYFVLTNAVPWLLLIGIGWPLLKDLNHVLNLSLTDLLRPWRRAPTISGGGGLQTD